MANRMTKRVGRREFIRRTTQLAAVGTVLGGERAASAVSGQSPEPVDLIPSRVLGKTGVKLPMLAYGGAALPRAWGNPLSDDDRVKLVRYAFDRGIRYFDTAGNYMESPAILAEALRDLRSQVFLTSKVEVTRAGATREAFEKVLGGLKTDHLDAVLIHGTPGLQQMSVEEAMKVHGELVRLRDEKFVRFIGFSAHGYFDKALALIDSGGFDLCMLSCGYLPRGYDQIWTARMTTLRDACVARAHQLGMGIVAMKVVGAGMLGAWSGYLVPGFDPNRRQQLPAAAIRHVLQDPRIHLHCIGMRLQEEIDANIRILSGAAAYTPEDRGLLAEFSAKLYETDAIREMKME